MVQISLQKVSEINTLMILQIIYIPTKLHIYEWLKAKRLSLNTTETEFMLIALIASRQRSALMSTIRLQIGAESIPRIEIVKSLGDT